MKLKNIILTLSAASTIFIFGEQSSNASSLNWHKGAPKVMIGNWKYNLHSDAQGGNEGIMTSWGNRTIKGVQGEHGNFIKTKRYKYIGNGKYAIKVSGYAGGDIYNETIKIKVYKGNKKMKFLSDGESNVIWYKTNHTNYKYSDWSFKN